MAEDKNKNSYKKFIQFVAGFFILILGITLILVWWDETVMLFKGALGFALALAGLSMLYVFSK